MTEYIHTGPAALYSNLTLSPVFVNSPLSVERGHEVELFPVTMGAGNRAISFGLNNKISFRPFFKVFENLAAD
jgi:hypothetical protein